MSANLATKVIKATPGDPGAIAYLAKTYGWTRELAVRVLSIANGFGCKAQTTEGGYVMVRRVEGDYRVEDHTGRGES